jgi:hypothetical protein
MDAVQPIKHYRQHAFVSYLHDTWTEKFISKRLFWNEITHVYIHRRRTRGIVYKSSNAVRMHAVNRTD